MAPCGQFRWQQNILAEARPVPAWTTEPRNPDEIINTFAVPVTLGPREYFVIGDNRGMSAADHDFGRVQADKILGKLIF